MDKPPKVFISYSWSSIQHQEWVKGLAQHLMDSGIDVILDIWELDLGHDTNHFMERIVSDKDLTKTLIISDNVYTTKANTRTGGVGIETQIISKEVYDSAGENKFIAVIAERDERGKPYIPTFYTSRMYVDLSTNDDYSENLEVLVRAIYGKPIHQKPPLGKRPAFLDEASSTASPSPILYNRATTLLKDGKPQGIPSLREYLNDALVKLEAYRIVKSKTIEFDDQVIESIAALLPYRNEILQVFQTALSYGNTVDVSKEIHSFLEGLAKYTVRPESVSSYNSNDFDNFKFIAREIFLSTVAIYIKEEKFIELDALLNKGFYLKDDMHPNKNLHDYSLFNANSGSLEQRNRRLNLGRTSLEADFTKDRSFTSPLSYESLMQADFALYIRSRILHLPYWPHTLVYIGHFPRPFEIFVRSTSTVYFEKVKPIFGVADKDALSQLADDQNFDRPFRNNFVELKGLLSLETMCTRL